MYDEYGNLILPSNLYGQSQSSDTNTNPFSTAFNMNSANTFNNEPALISVDNTNSGYQVDTTNIGNNSQEEQGGIFSGMLSNGKGGNGWGAPTLQAVGGVANAFLGFNQLSEGRKQNKIANQQWQAQFDIQKAEYDLRSGERAARVNATKAARSKSNASKNNSYGTNTKSTAPNGNPAVPNRTKKGE